MTDIPISLSGVTAEWLPQQFHNAGHEDSEIISDLFLSLLILPYISSGELVFSKTGILHSNTVSRFLRWNVITFFDYHRMLEVLMKMINIFKYSIFKAGRNADVIEN